MRPQAQPHADVLAVQPQDAADVPGDHRHAAGRPAPHLPRGVLLPQRGQQSPGDGGVRPGPGQHGEHPSGPVVVLPEGGEPEQRQRPLGGAEGELRGARPLHTHERWQEKRENTVATPIQPFLTLAVGRKTLLFLCRFGMIFLEEPFRKKHKRISGLVLFFLLPCVSRMDGQGVQILFFILISLLPDTSDVKTRIFHYRHVSMTPETLRGCLCVCVRECVFVGLGGGQ